MPLLESIKQTDESLKGAFNKNTSKMIKPQEGSYPS